MGRLPERRMGGFGQDHLGFGDVRVKLSPPITCTLDAHEDALGAARRDAPDGPIAVQDPCGHRDDVVLEPGQAGEDRREKPVGRKEGEIGVGGHLEHVVAGRILDSRGHCRHRLEVASGGAPQLLADRLARQPLLRKADVLRRGGVHVVSLGASLRAY